MIEIYVDGRSLGVKGAGFSVLMIFGKTVHKRSFKTEKLTSNQLEIKALEYVLKSIKPKFESENIKIMSSGRYAQLMLEKYDNGWMREPKVNHSLIDSVRKQWCRFNNISIGNDQQSNIILDLKKLTDSTVKNGVEVNEN